MRRPGWLSFVAAWALTCLAGCTQENPIFGFGVLPSDAGTPGRGGADTTDVRPEPIDERAVEGDGAPLVDVPMAGPDLSVDRSEVQTGDASAMDGVSPNGTLVAYWNFEDGQGSSVVADRSGNGNHGFLEGLGTTKAWVLGHTGTGLEFPPEVPGAESGVRVVLTAQLDALRTFTLAAWMKRQIKNSPGLWTIISRQRDNTIDEIFNLTSNQGGVEVFIPSVGASTANRAGGFVPGIDGRWVHVAATYDGQVLRAYADGAEIGTGKWANRLQSSNTPIYIGTNKNAGRSEPFEGVLDDVVMCDKALPAADIKALFQGASPLNYR